MSFAEQERALFDLLFDTSLRQRFCQQSTTTLTGYDLNDSELADFKAIRLDAIDVDASMRRHLILSQICQQLPMTFSLLSSVHGGIKLLKELINVHTMSCQSAARISLFGTQLDKSLSRLPFDSVKEAEIVQAVLKTELGLVFASAMLRQHVLQYGAEEATSTISMDADWKDTPVKLAAYVSVSVLPQSYNSLRQLLCPCVDTALWSRLSKSQHTSLVCKKIIANESIRLFMARAYVRKMSRLEPVIDHQTIELSDGFAPLLQHINGTSSVTQIIQQLAAIGAPSNILSVVNSGFQQLVSKQMLEFA